MVTVYDWFDDPRALDALAAQNYHRGLAEALIAAADRDRRTWDVTKRNAFRLVAGMDEEQRRPVLDELVRILSFGPWLSGDQARFTAALRAIADLADGGESLDPADRVYYREQWIAVAQHQVELSQMPEVRLVIEYELAAGRPVPATLVAAVRRTAEETFTGAEYAELAARLTDPPVNPGEAWADRALAQAEKGGAPWWELLAHAARVRSAKPSRAWERKARTLLTAIGEQEAAEAVVGWLARVGRRRTLQLMCEDTQVDGYDRFNENALRGLCWLLALVPPAPGDASRRADVLAGLVTDAPTRVSNAAVYALAQSGDAEALRRLVRLAGVVDRPTRKLVDAALDAEAQARGVTRAELDELLTLLAGSS
ncbi:hypothetical protein [Streptomyces sp. NPDC053069]|uniref:hypothetical protein n=1 Tax=Streptomyces sp. NPDC053069 TaxID=3365695 RepID=UPI0037D09D29